MYGISENKKTPILRLGFSVFMFRMNYPKATLLKPVTVKPPSTDLM